MVIKNRLERSFGPFGSSTGFFLLLGGLAATWFSPAGIILAAIGAFITFTSTGSIIDTDNKKVRFTNNIFGIIPLGKWIDIRPGMKLGLKRIHRGYQAYTRANQPVGIHYTDLRIILYEADNDEIMQLKRFTDRESAIAGLREMSSLLDIPVNDRITI
jgi:hypothetical protein